MDNIIDFKREKLIHVFKSLAEGESDPAYLDWLMPIIEDAVNSLKEEEKGNES